jgi:hypothetical protein
VAAAPWNDIVTFEIDMGMAARRHLEAADELAKGVRRDVAGYLYGIAAECAFKAMMLEAGLRPLAKESNEMIRFSHISRSYVRC